MALPVGLFCGLSPVLLPMWLGSDFAGVGPLFCIIVAPALVLVLVQQMFSVMLPLIAWRPEPSDCRLWRREHCLRCNTGARGRHGSGDGVATASAAVLLARHALFVPGYAARLLIGAWETSCAHCWSRVWHALPWVP